MRANFKVAITVPFAAVPKRGKPRAEKKVAVDPPSQPPRIAVLMALAIYVDQLLRDGHVKDQAELAKLAGVRRAWVTQVRVCSDWRRIFRSSWFSPNPRIARAPRGSASEICVSSQARSAGLQ